MRRAQQLSSEKGSRMNSVYGKGTKKQLALDGEPGAGPAGNTAHGALMRYSFD